MEEVLKIISEDIERKKNIKILPYHCYYIDLIRITKEKGIQDVNKILNDLYKSGKIKVGKTINSKYIVLNG